MTMNSEKVCYTLSDTILISNYKLCNSSYQYCKILTGMAKLLLILKSQPIGFGGIRIIQSPMHVIQEQNVSWVN